MNIEQTLHQKKHKSSKNTVLLTLQKKLKVTASSKEYLNELFSDNDGGDTNQQAVSGTLENDLATINLAAIVEGESNEDANGELVDEQSINGGELSNEDDANGNLVGEQLINGGDLISLTREYDGKSFDDLVDEAEDLLL